MGFYNRLLDEREQLADRIKNLDFFIKVSPAYVRLSNDMKSLLSEQLSVMRAYLSILDKRIQLIGEEYDKE